MKTAEQIMADAVANANKLIKNAEVESAIREELPETKTAVRMVHVYPLYGRAASVNYRADNTAEALAIFTAYAEREGGILPTYITRKGNMASVRATDDESADSSAECLATVAIDTSNATFDFYVPTKAGVVEVSVELPTHLFGHYRKDNPRAVKNYKLLWTPNSSTNSMFRAVNYGGYGYYGKGSAHRPVYAMYDRQEVENQFTKD